MVLTSLFLSIAAQMGKDVVSFLSWAAEPEMEERKLVGLSSLFSLMHIAFWLM